MKPFCKVRFTIQIIHLSKCCYHFLYQPCATTIKVLEDHSDQIRTQSAVPIELSVGLDRGPANFGPFWATLAQIWHIISAQPGLGLKLHAHKVQMVQNSICY